MMEKLVLPVTTSETTTWKANSRSWMLLGFVVICTILTWAGRIRVHDYTSWIVKPAAEDTSSLIKWTKCDNVILCATFDVPLDHRNPSAGVARLALAKYPAPTSAGNRLGSLFINPGGPGGSGVGMVYRLGEYVSKLYDGRYDIVSWDPRGINNTTPRVECFETQTEQDLFYIHTVEEGSISMRNLSASADIAILSYQLRAEEARNAAVIERCVNRTGLEALKFVGTATVARDLEMIARALEGDQPVNYWGPSYGSALGGYFINMFPDRVGRVVLDGVLNPNLWANVHLMQNAHVFYDNLYDNWDGFLNTCEEVGPDRCSLAKLSSKNDLKPSVDDWLQGLYAESLPVPYAKRPGILTKGHAIRFLFQAMYGPRLWPLAADYLYEAMSGNGTQMLDFLQDDVELDITRRAETKMAAYAVACPDSFPYTSEEKERILEITIDSARETYQVAEDFASMNIPERCHLWPVQAAERYTGPWNRTLSNRILVIGNTFDPVTPLISARFIHEAQADSVLIQQDGYGHTSDAAASLCTTRILRDYFLDGTLPKTKEILRPVDEPLWPRPRCEENISAWFGDALSEEELELLQLRRKMGREMERSRSVVLP